MNEQPRRSIAPVLFALALTATFLVVIGYAANQRRKAQAETGPVITILAPADGDVVTTPLAIRFISTRALTPAVGGWGDGRYHIHAWINGTEYMPAAADIKKGSDESYTWLIAAPVMGSVTINLGWADRAHRRLPASTPEISVTVR